MISTHRTGCSAPPKHRDTILACQDHSEAIGVNVVGMTDRSIHFVDPNVHRVELACPTRMSNVRLGSDLRSEQGQPKRPAWTQLEPILLDSGEKRGFLKDRDFLTLLDAAQATPVERIRSMQ